MKVVVLSMLRIYFQDKSLEKSANVYTNRQATKENFTNKSHVSFLESLKYESYLHFGT